MKKKDVINLIRYYSEGNSSAFREQAYEIAADFNRNGDQQLGEYILALLSDKNTFIPQELNGKSDFFRKMEYSTEPLPLPTPISNDLSGIVNAIGYNAGINKYLFSGAPGTGKTESAKQLARVLSREVYAVDFDYIIDSRLGQTSKNISQLFDEINSLPYPEHVIILFDEIDSLAMDRTDSRDLREMGRATSSVLKGLDGLKNDIVLIATTNLMSSFDKALIRRFDKVIDFNRYSQDDLLDISVSILESLLSKFKFAGRDVSLFKKIIRLMNPIPFPGDLKNAIKSSIAFSDPSNGLDYLRRLFLQVKPDYSGDIKELKKMGFTVREIEILSQVSKSKVARDLSEGK